MVRYVPTARWVTTCLLLAVYGGVSVLGYGLHDLFHRTHHHGVAHSGGCHACCCSHACTKTCAHDCSQHHGPAVPPSIAAITDVLQKLEAVQQHRQQHRQPVRHANQSTLVAVGPPCPICALLTQAQSTEISICSGTLIGEVPGELPVDEIRRPLYLPNAHFARGPPLC